MSLETVQFVITATCVPRQIKIKKRENTAVVQYPCLMPFVEGKKQFKENGKSGVKLYFIDLW